MADARLLPATINVAVKAGDAAPIVVNLYTDEHLTVPFDLSDYVSFAAQVRRMARSDSVLASADSITVLDGPGGQIEVFFSAASTRAVSDSGGRGVWDLEAVNSGGRPRTLVSGRFISSQDTTRLT